MTGYGRIKDEDVVQGLNLGFLKASRAWEIFNHFRDTGEKNRLFKALMVFHVLLLIPVTLTTIAAPFMIENTLEGLTAIMIGPMYSFQLFIKFNFFWNDTEYITGLMELLKRNFLTCIPNTMRLDAERILQKSAKRANLLGSVLVHANFGIMTLICLTPILRSEFFRCTLGITFFGEAPPGQNKALAYWYPVDVEASPWTQIIYIYEVLVGTWAAFVVSLFEITVTQSLILLCGHLEVLQYLLSKSKSKSDTVLTVKLSEYIGEHNKMMKIGNEMRLRFNFVVTLIIGSGSVILIFNIFNFFMGMDKGNWVSSVIFIIYMVYALAEVFAYCYASSELQITSEQVCFGAYSSEWNEMDINSRKALRMMMMRSRRAVVLRAGWYPVNMVMLNNILQTAYSTSMLMYRITTNSPITQ